MARILIVDDDPQFRRTLRLALRSCGYEVSDVARGKDAIDSVAAAPPDLVVLDWHLPDMDGVQTCFALHAHSDLPVIMVSGNRSNSKAAALSAGANDYISKPFSVSELLERIEFALKP